MKLQMKPKPNRNSVCLNQLLEVLFFLQYNKATEHIWNYL